MVNDPNEFTRNQIGHIGLGCPCCRRYGPGDMAGPVNGLTIEDLKAACDNLGLKPTIVPTEEALKAEVAKLREENEELRIVIGRVLSSFRYVASDPLRNHLILKDWISELETLMRKREE